MNFSKTSYDRLDYLAARWQDESAYEDFNEYIAEIRKVCATEGVKFIEASKRPFGFIFQKGDREFRLKVTAKAIVIKEQLPDFGAVVPEELLTFNPTITQHTEVNMVSKKSNPAPKKKTPAPAVDAKHAAIAKAAKAATAPKQNDDLTPPPFLDRLKGMTPAQRKAVVKAEQEANDRADKAEQTDWVMPTTNPVTAKKNGRAPLPAGSMTPKQIADEVGMNDRKLRRLLRAMAKKGTLKHDANGRWAITKADLAAIKEAATTSKK